MIKNFILLPFAVEYLNRMTWQTYGRYATLAEAKKSKAEAIRYDKEVVDIHYHYRILETKIVEE
jgi:hypothetical protein